MSGNIPQKSQAVVNAPIDPENDPALDLRLTLNHPDVEALVELNLTRPLDPPRAAEVAPHDQEEIWPRLLAEPVFQCSFCDKKFVNAQALGGHQNIHRAERAEMRKRHELGRALVQSELGRALVQSPVRAPARSYANNQSNCVYLHGPTVFQVLESSETRFPAPQEGSSSPARLDHRASGSSSGSNASEPGSAGN